MPVGGAGCKWTRAFAAQVAVRVLLKSDRPKKRTRLRLRPYRLAPHYEPHQGQKSRPRLWPHHIDAQ
jgi:hypothetical protein